MLGQHAVLRAALDDLDGLARAIGGPPDREKLRPKLEDFVQLFLGHLAVEEGVLLPILRTVDAWGRLRVERVEAEHAEQRALIVELVERARAGAIDEVARDVRRFVSDLRDDMGREDADVLDARLVCDEAKVIDAMGGEEA